MSFVLADLGQPEQAAIHRRTAFQDRCIIPALYRGEQEPITVLELVSTTGGNIRAEVFLSDRIFKRYLVATEFYDPSIPLPPHQLVFNAIGDVDLAAKALAGAQALLAHTTAPVMNPPAAVLETSRCDVTRRLAACPRRDHAHDRNPARGRRSTLPMRSPCWPSMGSSFRSCCEPQACMAESTFSA